MIKNIIFGFAALLFINWLFNIARINKLQQRIAEENQITTNLVKTLEKQDRIVDSLETIIKQITN